MDGFKVVWRNYGHWDVWKNDRRIYRIRGGPGNYWVDGDHYMQGDHFEGKTVGICMAYITDKLMFELIVAEGQTPQIIESWNI